MVAGIVAEQARRALQRSLELTATVSVTAELRKDKAGYVDYLLFTVFHLGAMYQMLAR